MHRLEMSCSADPQEGQGSWVSILQYLTPWPRRHSRLSGVYSFSIQVFPSSAIRPLQFTGLLCIRWMGEKIRYFHQCSLSVSAGLPDNEGLCCLKPSPHLDVSLLQKPSPS